MAQEEEKFILYDIPSKGPSPHCWSLNPWKGRYSLNPQNQKKNSLQETHIAHSASSSQQPV
jgi:hypothetical protein